MQERNVGKLSSEVLGRVFPLSINQACQYVRQGTKFQQLKLESSCHHFRISASQ